MPSPLLILGILLAISVAGNAVLGKLYTGALQDYAAEKQAYASFKEQVKVLGEQQEKHSAEVKSLNEARKKEADNANAQKVASLNAAIGKLRADADRAGSGKLSAAPTGSKCPDGQACFDRAEFERAYGGLVKDVRQWADEGSAVTLDLDTAKAWAQTR